MLSSSNSTVLKKRLEIIIYIPEIFDKQVIIQVMLLPWMSLNAEATCSYWQDKKRFIKDIFNLVVSIDVLW